MLFFVLGNIKKEGCSGACTAATANLPAIASVVPFPSVVPCVGKCP